MSKGMTSCRPPESEILNEKSNESENSLKTCLKLATNSQLNLQLTLQPTCNLATDTISRQAAIDELEEHRALFCDHTPESFSRLSYGDKSRVDEIDGAIAVLVNMPSAQPDIDEWCHDCKEYDKERHCCPRWNRVIRQTLKDAQPDIIHCGECKYYHDSDGCFFSTATTGANGFCHWAERKEGEADGRIKAMPILP